MSKFIYATTIQTLRRWYFCLGGLSKSLMCFFRYMNKKHSNISFTYEIEVNEQIPFLDILIHRTNSKFETSIHRKSTFSGVYLHFQAFMPMKYKIGLINFLLHRWYCGWGGGLYKYSGVARSARYMYGSRRYFWKLEAPRSGAMAWT